MADTAKLFTPLLKMQDSVISLMESAEELSKSAVQYNGEIARVLPLNLKSFIDKLAALLEGNQDSLGGMIVFLDNIPIGDVRDKPINARSLQTQSTRPSTPAPSISTAPDTSQGPQSAVLKESTDLSRYYKDQYASKPKQSLREEGRVSFQDILATEGLGLDLEEEEDVLSSVDIPDSEYHRLSASAHDFDDDHEVTFDDDEASGSAVPKSEEVVPITDWRNITRQTGGPSHEDLRNLIHNSDSIREFGSR